MHTSIGIREIVRRWRVIIVVTLIAVVATIWSHGQQVQTYTATTRVVVVPLAQWDETFLGTTLVRDSGDATRTAVTAAAELNSPRAAKVTADYLGGNWTPESVADAVKVSVFEETNVIEITARSTDQDAAVKLAEGFATANLADRWKQISGQLDARIATANSSVLASPGTGDGSENPTASQELARLQTLRSIRDSGSDPTMRIESTSPAVPVKQLSLWTLGGLATAGGLVVGILAAAGLTMLRRRTTHPTEHATSHHAEESGDAQAAAVAHAEEHAHSEEAERTADAVR
jgi:capsular polysaccharide biosynthesis protein